MTSEAPAVDPTAAPTDVAAPENAGNGGSAKQAVIVFHRPPGFREITDDDDRGAWLGGLLEDGGESLHQAAVQLRQIGIAHVSVYVLKAGPNVTSASLTVAVLPCPSGAPAEIAEALVGTLTGAQARVLAMPIGPVVGAVLSRSVTIAHEEDTPTDDGTPSGPAELESGEYRGYVPLPQYGCMLLLTLSTPMVPGWEAYALMMAGVLRTLRIEES